MKKLFRNKYMLGVTLALVMAVMLVGFAIASDVDVVSIVDVTAPTGSVTLAPGETGNITINMSVSGNQAGTATFEVYKTWVLSGNTFTGSNPQEFTVPPRAAQDPATTFSTTGTVTVAADQSPATDPFTLEVGVFDITNSNQTGAKLAAGDSSEYQVTVEAPPTPTNTPPSVLVSGVTSEASYEIRSVPDAICEVTDAEDGPSSFAATLSTVTGPLAAYGLGEQTASCSYTDAGGLTATASVTYGIVDTTDPVITFVSRTPANGNGWNNGDVTVEWSCTDSGSGVVAATVSTTVSIEGEDQSVTGTCEDHAGNTASDTQTGINIDKTAPTASASVSPAANANGWNNTDVTVTFTGSDGLSGIDFCTAAAVLTSEGAGQSASGTCTDKAGNVSALATASGINIDKTKPTASASVSPAANANGWNNSDVTVSFTGDDALSGIASCSEAVVLSAEGAGQSASGTCTDKAGNVSAAASVTVNIDLTAPTVALVGGPANGGTYYFGFVPAAPTCDASDALSGLDGACSVSGYSTALGSHTVTASATDKAGNSASASSTYTVLAWTLSGFYQPVDMNGVFNTVKGGSTVPLKFEIFAGSTELTDTAYVKSLKYGVVACSATAPNDSIETVATGGTSLRYDSVAGQFVYNWQTPKAPGICYSVTMTTQDGSSLTAYFKLK